jgi:hypothetical protein
MIEFMRRVYTVPQKEKPSQNTENFINTVKKKVYGFLKPTAGNGVQGSPTPALAEKSENLVDTVINAKTKILCSLERTKQGSIQYLGCV